jgi:capsular exopolysaccharide synthesis family protein
MVHLQARIAELDRQIAAEIAFIKETLRKRYEAALTHETELSAKVDELKAEVMVAQNDNIPYNILNREVDTNQQLYDGLLQSYKQIGVTGGIDASNLANNVSIIDSAKLPNAPYTPKLALNVGLALVLGVMFGGAAGFIREQLDDTHKTPEDIEENLGLPVLGVIPRSRSLDRKYLEAADPALTEAFRSLRTAVQFSLEPGAARSLLITSPRSGEGKSTTAVLLASNFARLGLRVLLIDADLRKPTLQEKIGAEHGRGLSDYLNDPIEVPSFYATETPNLMFLPSGPVPPNPTELLASPAMEALLKVGSEKFDLTILDGPPVAGLADGPLLASKTGGTILVVQASNTRRSACVASLRRLHQARAGLMGIAVNKFDFDRAGYLSGYVDGYGAVTVALGNGGGTRRWLPFHNRAS